MKDNLNYEEAFKELTRISKEIESEEVSVDLLAEKVKRAAELIDFCQLKLKNTEDQVQKILSKMAKN